MMCLLTTPSFYDIMLAWNGRGNASSSQNHKCHEERSRATSSEFDSSLRISWENASLTKVRRQRKISPELRAIPHE
jgi:hypothetical protein